MKQLLKLAAVTLFLSTSGVAQGQHSVENSIFWEISGNDLPESSYLFGTYHILGREYIDSLSNVNAAFQLSRSFISEVNFDSTQIMKVAMASLMKDSTLDQLLSPQAYDDLAKWLKSLTGYEISLLNKVNPLTIQMLITTSLQESIYGKANDLMDLYFEARAKSAGKSVSALETIDDQLQALYSMSYKRQAEILEEYLKDKELAKQQLIDMNALYRLQDLAQMEALSNDQFNDEEIQVMLYQRNDNWMNIIPDQIKSGSVFIAVGAMHLAGEKGLVNQLRQLGYTVNPLPLR